MQKNSSDTIRYRYFSIFTINQSITFLKLKYGLSNNSGTFQSNSSKNMFKTVCKLFNLFIQNMSKKYDPLLHSFLYIQSIIYRTTSQFVSDIFVSVDSNQDLSFKITLSDVLPSCLYIKKCMLSLNFAAVGRA